MLSEVCIEILFICLVIDFLGVKVDYPVVTHVDNIGAAFLARSTAGVTVDEMYECASPLCT